MATQARRRDACDVRPSRRRLESARMGRAGRMTSRSLLAHVVAKFAPKQWENLATESLHFLLQRPGGQCAISAVLSSLAFKPGELRWSTQAASAEDSSIPDLVGYDPADRPAGIIEVKFWAALTSNQPLGYLDRQTRAFPGEPSAHLLMFLVPQRRLQLVAAELAARLGQVAVPTDLDGVARLARGDERVVVIAWTRVLAELQIRLEEARDTEGLGDLAQLRGLCDRADEDVMLPIAAEEVSDSLGRRVHEFCELANGTADLLVSEGLLNTKGLRSAAGQGWYTRYVKSGSGHVFGIGMYSWSWAHRYPSPWWVRFWQASPEVIESISQLSGHPLLPHQEIVDGQLQLALSPPVGMEQPAAIEHLASAVRAVCSALDAIPVSAQAALSPSENREHPQPDRSPLALEVLPDAAVDAGPKPAT